jgi:hypothetical protein
VVFLCILPMYVGEHYAFFSIKFTYQKKKISPSKLAQGLLFGW